MAKVDIVVNMDRRCVRCRKKGATQSGLCLACIAKAIKRGEFDHVIDKARRERGRHGNNA